MTAGGLASPVGLVANGYAIPGLVALAAAWTMAVVVFLAGPSRGVNRALALLLAFEGAAWGSGTGLVFVVDDPAEAYALQNVAIFAMMALPALYLVFVSYLDAPLVSFLRPIPTRALVVAAAVAGHAYLFTHEEAFTPEMIPAWYAPWDAHLGVGFLIVLATIGAVSVFSLVATAWAWARARTDAARRRARFIAAAFGVRDLSFAALTLVLPFVVPLPPSGAWTDLLFVWLTPIVTTLFVLLLAYGLLRAQLFDIDLRIKVTISRGAVVGTFVVVFVVVSEVVQNYLNDTAGYIAGGVATAVLLLAVSRVRDVADRLADAAMPSVSGSPEYLAFKKMDIYRGALESAHSDGTVTAKERALLDTLRAKLGLRAEDAALLEREVLGDLAVAH